MSRVYGEPRPSSPPPQSRPPQDTHKIAFGEALRFWAKLGCISFGGPAGQIALMHRELVERRRWISEQRFLHALNYCMLLPGPEAQQLATYLGWLMHRTWGGLLAGALFVLPSLVLLIGLSWMYVAFGDQPIVAGLFAGIKPAVLAIVLQAAHRLGMRTLRTPVQWGLAGMGWLALSLSVPFPFVILVAAGIGWAWPRVSGSPTDAATRPTAEQATTRAVIDDDTPSPPHASFSRARLVTVLLVGAVAWGLLLGLASLLDPVGGTLATMARFFTQAALVTFGGAYAVLPYLVQGAVETHGWLSAAQMIDGLALGESTPGPLIMVVAFVGFLGGHAQEIFGPGTMLASGVAGACVATAFTFLPSFVFIFAGGPLVEATRGRLGFTGPLAAISATVVGVIIHLAIFFAGHVLWRDQNVDLAALGLTLLAGVLLIGRRWNVLAVLGISAMLGLAISLLRA